MGLFDSIIGGVTSFFGGGDPLPDSPDAIAGDLSGLPSELGGSLLDQLTGSGGAPADLSQSVNFGGNAGDLFGGIFGQGVMPNLFGGDGGINPTPDDGSQAQIDHPLPTDIPITLGGGMDSLSLSQLGTFGPFTRARRPGVPWKRIIRMVRTAVKYFGPSVALAIVQQLAQLLAANGVQDASGQAITGGEILFRSMQSSSSGRRNRGITGRQLSITGKTIRKLNRMHAAIASISRSGGGHHRRSSNVVPFRRKRRSA